MAVLKFASGNEVEFLTASGIHKVVQGQNRDVLTFTFATETHTLAEIDEMFSASACEKLIIDDMYVHNGYVIRDELKKVNVEVQASDVSSAGVYEDRIMVSMAQRTYAEEKLAENSAQIADLQLGLVEVYESILGGEE